MMAILMCGELLLGTYQIRQPTERLQLNVASHLSATSTNTVYESASATIWDWDISFQTNQLIFRLMRQVNYEMFEYQLDYEMTYPKYTFSMDNHIEELEEPSEKINLKKLKAKLRDSLKAKELLIRYYNS